jgi:hypothetical protein
MVFLVPELTDAPEPYPMNVFFSPVVPYPASLPTAVLLDAVVFVYKASLPMATLLVPVVL